MAWRATIWAVVFLGLSLSPTFSALAQDRFYTVRINPETADAPVAGYTNPEVNGESFWLRAESYVNQEGYCRAASYDGPDRVTNLAFTTIFAALSRSGFSGALPWFEQEGLYPFGEISLDVADPRAPDGYPIFCRLRTSSEDQGRGSLRPVFFDFEADLESNSAYVFARMQAPEEDQQDMARVLLGASLTLAELWDYGRRAALDTTELGPEWLHLAAYDALTVASAESADRLYFDAYDEIEHRLSFLQGAYHRRLAQPDGGIDFDVSSGAFIRFLIENHMRDGWANLDPLLNSALDVDDAMSGIDAYVDSQDEDLRGLEHAFPAFVAYQASHFTDRYSDTSVTAERWLDDNFGGCETVRISELSPAYRHSLQVEPYAARCLILRAEAESTAWHGDAHLRTQIVGAQTGDDRINRVFVSFAGLGDGPLDEAAEGACSTNVSEDGDGRTCIAEPSAQGTNSEGLMQRYYYFSIGERTPDQSPWIVVLLSYVPERGSNGGSPDFPGVEVELAWSLDTVIGDPGELVDVGPSNTGEFDLYDVSTASLNHGTKVGLAPISSALSDVSTSQENILDGRATPVDGGLLQMSMAAADTLLQFVDEAGNGFSLILNDASILETGYTGTTDSFASVVSRDGYIGIPDPDAESRIEIIENTPDTLHFIAEEGFCMLPQDEYLQRVQQTNGDLCEAAQRITARGQATVAFPQTRRAETMIEAVETEEYRALRDFRLQRIYEAAGIQPRPEGPETPPGSSGPGQGNGPGGGLDVTPNPNGDSPIMACRVRDANNQCDCSCEANVCLMSQMAAATATAQERSCRLTCGRSWMQCPGP